MKWSKTIRAQNGSGNGFADLDYPMQSSVSAERISIISYGSDRPVCAEKTDVCRAKNRRVHFLVKQG